MSAVLEQYLQAVVVDKLDKTISKQFQEMKDDLHVLKKLKLDYTNLRIEIESLKKYVSDSNNDIKEMLSQNSKKAAATKKPAPAKIAVAVKPLAKKPVVKKPAVKKKTTKK